ncbi:MAG: hypothetical protein ACKVX7_12730 [Planctomycetota bacterium]
MLTNGWRSGWRWICIGVLALSSTNLWAQDEPDVIVGDLQELASWGNVGGIYAYSIGTTSCNEGTEVLDWYASTPAHPVIGQQIYRLKEGRFEQIGISWLKHSFCALAQSLCGTCIVPPVPCELLGVGCSDPYTAARNGTQSTLGPRGDVNAYTGVFPYPFSAPPFSGIIMRRVQVAGADMNPTQNPGALYFAEGHYVTQDDAQAGNGENNVSWRRIQVAGTPSTSYPISLMAGENTHREEPAIFAWQDYDPAVEILEARVPGEGLMYLAQRVTPYPSGTSWHYEYAIYNMNSDISARSFTVTLPPGVLLSNISFTGVPYHSGEVYSSTPWNSATSSNAITWSTSTFTANPNAFALRWSRQFNFRFDANTPPTTGTLAIGLFKATGEIVLSGLVPSTGAVPPVANFVCTPNAQGVQLSWTNGAPYSAIELRRDGATIATIPGASVNYLDTTSAAGLHSYDIIGFIGPDASIPNVCTVDVPEHLVFSFGSAIPTMIGESGASFSMTIAEFNGGDYLPGSCQLYLDTGSGYLASGLAEVAPLQFTVNLPALPCASTMSFYLSAATTQGETLFSPEGAPAVAYPVVVATALVTLFEDFMETDTGWVVGAPGDTATTSGLWVRVDPNGTDAQPEDDSPDTGALCWVTGQGVAGAALGAADVDGGSTTLISPVLSLAGSNGAVISYRRWYSNDSGAAPGLDVFDIEVTADGVSWVVVETIGPTGAEASGDWYYHEFRVADFVTPSATVRVRFRASDTGAASIIEAAIDDFAVRDYVCGPVGGIFTRGDCNGSGQFDISDASFLLLQLFVPGSPGGPCQDACDLNDDSLVNIADAVYGLIYLFQFGASPLPPFPGCGSDPTFDSVSCDVVPPNCP